MRSSRGRDVTTTESAAAGAALRRDIEALLRATSGNVPGLTTLAGTASKNLERALRYASGRPADDRWQLAYQALATYLRCFRACSGRSHDLRPFVRLTLFLAENADLAQPAGRYQRPGRTRRFERGRA